jgi:plastocyanin
MTAARSRIWLAAVIAVLVVTGSAAGKPTPEAKCLSAKLKASAKKAVVKVGCYAKAAKKQKPLDPACPTKAETAFTKAVAKAEGKGGCASVGDAPALEATIDEFVDAVVTALPDGGTKPGGKCTASKANASAKYASAELLCHAKAAMKGVGVDAECIEKAEAAFEKAFAKAEQKGDCATTGDVDALDATADEFVDDVLADLTPGASTTTTVVGTTSTTVVGTTSTTVVGTTSTTVIGTTSTTVVVTTSTTNTLPGSTTTTNTLPGSTTTTTLGPTLHMVMVGRNGLLTFEPATLSIKVGDTVRWVWGSSFHNVVSGQVTNGVGAANGIFCSPNDTNCATAPLSDVNDTYDHTFTTAGTFPYFCSPHASTGMVGTIAVQP